MVGGLGWQQENAARAMRELIAEDEHAPHIIVVVDEALGVGPAAGPFYGAVQALAAAERLEAALNADAFEPPVRTTVMRLFSPREGSRRGSSAPEPAGGSD